MFLVDYHAGSRNPSGPNSKPELDDDLLMHYGIRGMKWGVRRGSSKTGISRARGAMVDRNDRQIMRMKNTLAGKGLIRDKVEYKLNQIALGKSMTDRLMKVNIKELNDQNARLKKGKATFRDKLHVTFNTTPLDLVVSNRPKK